MLNKIYHKRWKLHGVFARIFIWKKRALQENQHTKKKTSIKGSFILDPLPARGPPRTKNRKTHAKPASSKKLRLSNGALRVSVK